MGIMNTINNEYCSSYCIIKHCWKVDVWMQVEFQVDAYCDWQVLIFIKFYFLFIKVQAIKSYSLFTHRSHLSHSGQVIF